MDFEWTAPKRAAEMWGISERQVQSLCMRGKVPGVVRVGRTWLIPKDAAKPIDGRSKSAKQQNSTSATIKDDKENFCGFGIGVATIGRTK